jgi:hypothetical protein
MANGGLMALPNRNLVSNVGFGEDGTHTTVKAQPTKVDHGLGILNHPSFLLRSSAADAYSFDHHFSGASKHRIRRLLHRVKARLYYHLNHLPLVSR